MRRRTFLQAAGTAALLKKPANASQANTKAEGHGYSPGRIANDYSLFLPGEREALERTPELARIEREGVAVPRSNQLIGPGESVEGWLLLAIGEMNGILTAVFEKNASFQGALVYMTEQGVILHIPKRTGDIRRVRPRPINAPVIRFTRETPYRPGPDRLAEYILNSNEDPCYENVAALGPEYIGWTLVGNEQAGPLRSLFLEADGTSRQLTRSASCEAAWAPDLAGRLFDPSDHLPDAYPNIYKYLPGYSKRTLLGGFLPAANTAVWNPESKCGYEVIVALPPGEDATPMARVRAILPEWMNRDKGAETADINGARSIERYIGSSREGFYSELAGIANQWQHFFEDRMKVEIPDSWLLDAARAGIVLSRCSYRGLNPTYQIGEGGYTKIPERSHALFPVAHYEFIWAQQLWNLTAEAEPYFQHYLDHYILPDGNFLYNTQDQVEAPLNTGVFLWNSARAYDYTHDLEALQKRLPVLERMIEFVLARYEYSKRTFPARDRRHGLIWGSPEADLGDPENDYPNSHPYYFQNATWTWRGLKEHARVLALAGREHNLAELARSAEKYGAVAAEMRSLIERSIDATIAAENAAMRASGITPFTPDDIHRDPRYLTSYENHRFMMDWFTADWGVPSLDLGHLKHRLLAGQQIMGLHTDGDWSRTSNFMSHGTLSVRIRQEDYRPFLLTLYALCCYTADCGNFYSPEDALLPGSFPGEGSKYGWSAVVNSVLQPAMGLRWMLCYEESDQDVCHLQKAVPKHWFAPGERIHIERCPTRFGELSWTTESGRAGEWRVQIAAAVNFSGRLMIHVHPPGGEALASASAGRVYRDRVMLDPGILESGRPLEILIRS
jgi:hypothetical protein